MATFTLMEQRCFRNLRKGVQFKMEDKKMLLDEEKLNELLEKDKKDREEFEEFKEEYFPDVKVTYETMEELTNGKGEDTDVE